MTNKQKPPSLKKNHEGNARRGDEARAQMVREHTRGPGASASAPRKEPPKPTPRAPTPAPPAAPARPAAKTAAAPKPAESKAAPAPKPGEARAKPAESPAEAKIAAPKVATKITSAPAAVPSSRRTTIEVQPEWLEEVPQEPVIVNELPRRKGPPTLPPPVLKPNANGRLPPPIPREDAEASSSTRRRSKAPPAK